MIKEVHVVHIEDLKPHNLSYICSCEPKFQTYQNGNITAVHNSFDRREIDEFLFEIVKEWNPKHEQKQNQWAAICLDKTHHSN